MKTNKIIEENITTFTYRADKTNSFIILNEYKDENEENIVKLTMIVK